MNLIGHFANSKIILSESYRKLEKKWRYGPADDVLPAEPEDDVPHGVHDAAGHPATLLLLLLGQPCNRYL